MSLLCESQRLFAKYIGQYRLSVCPFVCKSVCLSVCHTPYRPQFCNDQDYFFTVDSAYTHIDPKLFLKKSAKGQGQGHQKT